MVTALGRLRITGSGKKLPGLISLDPSKIGFYCYSLVWIFNCHFLHWKVSFSRTLDSIVFPPLGISELLHPDPSFIASSSISVAGINKTFRKRNSISLLYFSYNKLFKSINRLRFLGLQILNKLK